MSEAEIVGGYFKLAIVLILGSTVAGRVQFNGMIGAGNAFIR
jgi:hypothetical protein